MASACDEGIIVRDQVDAKLRRAAGRKAHMLKKSTDYERRSRKGCIAYEDDDSKAQRAENAPSYQDVLDQDELDQEAAETTATDDVSGLEGAESSEASPPFRIAVGEPMQELYLPTAAQDVRKELQRRKARMVLDEATEDQQLRGRLQRKADRVEKNKLEVSACDGAVASTNPQTRADMRKQAKEERRALRLQVLERKRAERGIAATAAEEQALLDEWTLEGSDDSDEDDEEATWIVVP